MLWIRSEIFDHGVLHTTVHWTPSKVLQFMESLRAGVASMSITRAAWVEVATVKCEPVLTESEADAYWHLFTVLREAVGGSAKEGDSIDIRWLGLFLMCQVVTSYRVRAEHSSADYNERAPGSVSPRSSRRSPQRNVSSAPTAASRGRHTAEVLLTFVQQHLSQFLQIACFALSAEPMNVTAEEFDRLGLILRAGSSLTQPHKLLSEGIAELASKKTMTAKDLKRAVEAELVWNDKVYPASEISTTVLPEVSAGQTLNISGLSKATWFQRPPGGGVDFLNITSCTECVIYITFEVQLCLIAGCHDCTIIMGPVSSLCTIQSCEKISVHVAANCFKMENATDSSAFLYCKIPPILTGDTRGIKLAPYNVLYSLMTHLLQNAGMQLSHDFVDIWAHPICCTLASTLADETLGGSRSIKEESTQSTTYHFVHPNNFQPIVVPEANPRAGTAIKSAAFLCLPETYSDALSQRSNEMRRFHRQLSEITDENKRKIAQQTIQGHFREWLQSTGRSRQLADLARLQQSSGPPTALLTM